MTLVDDDHVKKLGGNIFEYFVFFVWPCYSLIETQVDFIGRINLPVFDLGHDRSEWLEVIDQGLIGQDIPVDQKQAPFNDFCLPEPPDDLKCRIGFAGACGHHYQHTLLAFGDSFNNPINGFNLVIAWFFSRTVSVIGL